MELLWLSFEVALWLKNRASLTEFAAIAFFRQYCDVANDPYSGYRSGLITMRSGSGSSFSSTLYQATITENSIWVNCASFTKSSNLSIGFCYRARKMIALIVLISNHYISTHELYNTLSFHISIETHWYFIFNIGKLKHCSIDEKEDNKGISLRLCLGISPPLVCRANITLEN